MRFPRRGLRGPVFRALSLAAPLLLASASRAQTLTLEEAVRLATTRNERPLAAAELAEAAEAHVRRARAFFFPDVSAAGNYARRSYESVRQVGGEDVVLSSRDALSGSATARQILFDARAWPLYRQAKSDRDAARLEASEERRLTGFEAADAFLTTLGLEQVAGAAERRTALAKTNLRDAQARFDAAIASSNDVTRAELEVATGEREEIRAKNGVDTAVLQLANLLNAPVRRELASPSDLLGTEGAEDAGVDTLVEEARGRRLDVAARRKRAEALRFYAKEPMNRFFPSLSASAQWRWTNDTGLSGRSATATFGLDLAWSLFDSGLRFADKAERDAQARAADLDARARERSVALDVEKALASLANARAAVKQATVALEAARKNASETTALYREGLSTAFAVADSTQRLFEADVALVRERLGFAIAILDLRAALGLDPLGKEPTP